MQGEAINPWNLSLFERMTGHAAGYDRAKDEEDRWALSFTQPNPKPLKPYMAEARTHAFDALNVCIPVSV